LKATLLRKKKINYPDGCIAEVIVWQLPKATPERLHGYKYRLNYNAANGVTLLRFDNEAGKGDHMHILGTELPYKFESLDKLFHDFSEGVNKARRGK
jgi:hypothetical protein